MLLYTNSFNPLKKKLQDALASAREMSETMTGLMCVNEFLYFGYVNSNRANENYLPNAQMSNKCDHRAHTSQVLPRHTGHQCMAYEYFLVKCLLALKQSLKHANAINNTVAESRAALEGNRQR